MTKNKRHLLAAVVILTVFIIKFFSQEINHFLGNDRAASNFYVSILIQVLYYLVPTLVVLFIFYKPAKVPGELGLDKGFLEGLLCAFAFTLPMLAGYYLMGNYNADHSLARNISFAFKDGFREEVFYRAFLFGQLFRRAKWGFIPAVAINGVIFGISHLYQAHSLGDSMAIFAITFAGAVWFAWLFMEWRDNLWIPIFLHFFMNPYWSIFSTEQTAMGGLMLNLPRILTIFLSIYVTIRLVKRKYGRFRVNRTNLLRNPTGYESTMTGRNGGTNGQAA